MNIVLQSLGISVLLATGVQADTCPADKTIAGPSERTLAGFNIGLDTISDVMKRMGKPQKSKYVLRNLDPNGPQWVKHKWIRGQTALSVSGQADQIQILQVSSEQADPAYATGRGLRLGDARTKVEELYGTTFVEGHVTGPENRGAHGDLLLRRRHRAEHRLRSRRLGDRDPRDIPAASTTRPTLVVRLPFSRRRSRRAWNNRPRSRA